MTSAFVRRKGSSTFPTQLCSAIAVNAVNAAVIGKNMRFNLPVINMTRVNVKHDPPDRQTTKIRLAGCKGR